MADSSSQRAFVAGATGFTGRAVVRVLRAAGIPTWAHVRPNSARAEGMIPAFEAEGAQVVRTEWNAEALNTELAAIRPTLVFSLLGITQAGAKREQKRTGQLPDYDTVDYGMTRLLIDATRAQAPQARFLYLSSIGVSEARPSNAYMLARWKCETDLRASGLSWTIARPSFLTGPERDESRPMESIGAALTSGLGRALALVGATSLERNYSPIDNQQLAKVLVQSTLDPAWANRVLEARDMPRR
jgi:nucleoside-diphosphate-sugar epimerase